MNKPVEQLIIIIIIIKLCWDSDQHFGTLWALVCDIFLWFGAEDYLAVPQTHPYYQRKFYLWRITPQHLAAISDN